jgi:hypothetical protein
MFLGCRWPIAHTLGMNRGGREDLPINKVLEEIIIVTLTVVVLGKFTLHRVNELLCGETRQPGTEGSQFFLLLSGL